MQAYQTAPCPFCGATWNPPGAQTCTNCHNQLPAQPPAYAPPGYAPQQGQPQQPGESPFGASPYQQQAGFPQTPGAYSGAPGAYPGPQQPGFPGQPGYPGQAPYAAPGQPAYPQVQAGQYPGYAPYGQQPGYPGAPYPGAPGYPGLNPAGQASSGLGTTTLSIFGQSVTVPFVIPPAVLKYQKQIVYGAIGVVALLIVLFGVLPAVASSQIAGANNALATTISHQPKVDAGFASFFAPDSSSTDLNVVKAGMTKEVQSVNDALALVQSDEKALSSSDQVLSILGIVALPSKNAIAGERQRIAAALDGLKQADTALTSGSNQGKVVLPLYDAMIDFTKMYAALGKHDLAGAAAPYPDAHAKVQQAIAATQAPGIPSGMSKQLSAFNDLLENSEALIQAIQNKDAASVKKYSDAVQAGLKTIQALSNAVPSDYEVKTYGADQKAYDAAIKALKG